MRLAATLIVPAHNEELRLLPTLEAYTAALADRYGHDFELMVVCNGCCDGTAAVAMDFARRNEQTAVLSIAEPIGKGGAVLEGFRHARGDRVAFADADGATSPESMLRLLDALADADVVVGSRRIADSRIVRRQPLQRRALGNAFAFAVHSAFDLSVRDTQCGAKALRGPLARTLADLVHERRWAFDVDLLLCALAAGAEITEIGVEWTDQPGSRLRLMPTAVEVTQSLWRLHRRRVPRTGRAVLHRPIGVHAR